MIELCNIIDENAKRKWIHFAKEYKNRLFTIQEDSILDIWNIELPFKLKKITSVPLEGRFYEPTFQFSGDKFLLRTVRGNRIAIVDFQNIEAPTVIAKETENGYMKGACIANGKLYVQISEIHKEDFNFQISDIPSLENPEPEISLAIPVKNDDAYNCAFYSLVVDNTIYWVNQDSIFVMETSTLNGPKAIATKKIVDLGIGYPIQLPEDRMIVLETADDVRIGINDLDISNKNVKRKSKGILKNHCIRGWQLIDETLYIVHLDFKKINKERKYKTYISTVDVSGDPKVTSTKELPIIEVYGDDSSTIYWFYISEESYLILLGNGNVYKFPF